MRLRDAIGLLSGIAPGRAGNPELTHLHLSTDPQTGAIVGRATNGELDVAITTAAEADLPDARLIPPQGFAAFLSSLPGDPELAYDVDGQQLMVRSGAVRGQFGTAAPDSYPDFPEAGDSVLSLVAEAGQLRAALAVRYATSGEDYRAIFRGVQIELRERGYRTVASDGFRLAVYDTEGAEGETRRAFVVPRKALDTIVKLLPGDQEHVELKVGRGHLFLAWPGVHIAVALMEGQFPDYERVVPGEFTNSYELPRAPLLEALKRLRPLTDKQTARVDLEFTPTGGLQLTAKGDYGRARDFVSLERYSGDGITVSYNLHYLLEALQHLDVDGETGRVSIQLSGPVTPSVISGQRAFAVVVPLRT